MPDLSPLILVGAGGFGREVAALVEAINEQTPTWDLVGFVDDDPARRGASVLGYPVRGDTDWLARQADVHFVTAIGAGSPRRRIAERLRPTEAQAASLRHPSVSLHRTAEVGAGTVLCKGVATTVNVRVGPHVVLNLNCTVGHDSTIGAFTTLHPGVHISGAVELGRGVTMGTGSVVLPDTTVGPGTTVGAGGVVVDDLPPDCTAVGVPARPRA